MGYFGIPFRNGVPIGLGSVAGFGAPQEFSPSELFLGGTAGAWYDPSDLSTLFTTSAGTTQCAMPGGGAAISVGRMLDKSGNGNHAIAFNDTTARPELRARVNLLTYSEEFDNGAWNTNSGSIAITANQTTAPDGTNTADLFTEAAGARARIGIFYPFASALASASYTCSVYVKQNAGSRFVRVVLNTALATAFACVDINPSTGAITQTLTAGAVTNVSSSVSSVGNGWWRVSITGTQAFQYMTIAFVTSATTPAGTDFGYESYTGSTANSIYIWGADLRPANIGANVPAYQRIADANTYDTSGFPLYLRFDGIDDSMYTPAGINFSGTDKMSVFAGVRKLSDATTGMLAETSVGASSTNGAWLITVPDTATNRYGFGARGTSFAGVATTSSTYNAPVSNVLTAIADISAPVTTLRANGTVAATSGTTLGTGNFGNHSLFIGTRNNTSFPLNGHLYSLIIAGSAVSAGNISATESWVAGRTGIQI